MLFNDVRYKQSRTNNYLEVIFNLGWLILYKQAKLHSVGRIDNKLSKLPLFVTKFIESKEHRLLIG